MRLQGVWKLVRNDSSKYQIIECYILDIFEDVFSVTVTNDNKVGCIEANYSKSESKDQFESNIKLYNYTILMLFAEALFSWQIQTSWH